MGLLRRLIRALTRTRRPKRVEIRHQTIVREEPRALPPRIVVQQTTEIRVVEVRELRRLSGIDAPEIEHPYGKTAKWTLVKLCKGHEIRAVFDGDLSHDRTVATCYLPDGRDLSAEMVKAGMAIDWPKFSRGKYSGLEPDGIRKKLWRCDARQKGRMPPKLPD
jgi:micrococcal nuclease